jgi:polysaccharide biosynthesis transport protein
MTLNTLLAGLRRRWYVVVSFVVLGALAAVGYGLYMTPVYEGETRLFVSLQTTTLSAPAELVAGNNYASQKVLSYVELAMSPRVLDRVATEIGGDPATIAEDVLAESLPNSAIITITGDSSNPEDAALLTNTVANVFADTVVNQIESPIGGGPGPVKVEVLATAIPPTDPVLPNMLLFIALGLFGGFVFGFAVAVVLALTDRKVRDRADVIATVDRNVLGVVSTPRSKSSPLTEVAISDFRTLAATIATLARRQTFASLAVASPVKAPPAAETAAGLAQALAEAGLTTVVVDTVFDGTGISSYLGADDLPGVRDVLSGQVRLTDAVASTSIERLSVLPVGLDDSVTPSALSGTAFTAIVEQLSASADFVVIDAGVVLGHADALAARASADQAIVAVDAGSCSRQQLAEAVEQLEIIGTPLLGIVVAQRKRRLKGERLRVTVTATTASKKSSESPERILLS